MTDKKHPIACVAGFIFDQDYSKVLIGTRYQNTEIPGEPQFCIPGGKIDWNETAVAALEREILEETGCRITSARFLGYRDDIFADTDKHCCSLYFDCILAMDSPQPETKEPEKQGDWKWVPLDEVPDLFASAHEMMKHL